MKVRRVTGHAFGGYHMGKEVCRERDERHSMVRQLCVSVSSDMMVWLV